jgi:hypothetical protein
MFNRMSKKKIRCPECGGTGKAIGGVCTLCCSMGEINAPESEMDAIRAANPQLAASMEKFGADMAAATKRQLCKNESPALNSSELEGGEHRAATEYSEAKCNMCHGQKNLPLEHVCGRIKAAYLAGCGFGRSELNQAIYMQDKLRAEHDLYRAKYEQMKVIAAEATAPKL